MPPLERLLLHIGLPKTGTKTLQLTMSLNRGLLRRHGFVYPTLTGERHLDLPLYAANESAIVGMRARSGLADPARFARFVDQVPARLTDALTASGVHTAILSSEHCSSLLSTTEEITRLHRLLVPLARQLRVILYLRRQDDLAVSLYSAAVRAGHTGEFELVEGPAWFDYLSLLDRWADVFGPDSLDVRVFEPAQLDHDGLLADFCRAIAFEPYEQLDRPPDQNTSLDIHALEFLKRFNTHVPVLSEACPNPSRGDIVQAIGAISSKARLRPNLQAARAFLDKYAASNSTVARKYLNRADGVLFTEEPQDRPERSPSLDVEKVIEIAAELWQWQERRHRRRRQGE